MDKLLGLLLKIAKIETKDEDSNWKLYNLVQDCLAAVEEDTLERKKELEKYRETLLSLGKSLGFEEEPKGSGEVEVV